MRRNILPLICNVLLPFLLIACQNDTAQDGAVAETEELSGTAEGFGGPLTVEVMVSGDVITSVEVTEHNETEGYGTNAIDQLPDEIVSQNSTDVDVVSGATVTSEALLYAVNNAIDPQEYPDQSEDEEEAASEEAPVVSSELYHGVGFDSIGRIGPGQDDTGTPVYSFNVVVASTLFDEEDRIVELHVDILEVATPNYDGDGMPHLSGFPGQGGYNNDEDHDEEVDGVTEDTEDYFLSEIETWETKRERGDSYVFSATGTWSEQMNVFENLFKGMTVTEVAEWFDLYTSDINGKPLVSDMEETEDQDKYAGLDEEEQEMLADIVTGATMSLRDPHGDIINAIQKSFENKSEQPILIE